MSRQYPSLSSVLPDQTMVYADIRLRLVDETCATHRVPALAVVYCTFVARFQAKTNGFVIDKQCLETIYKQMTDAGATPSERMRYDPIYCPNTEQLVGLFPNLSRYMKGIRPSLYAGDAMRKCYVYIAKKRVYLADVYALNNSDDEEKTRYEREDKIRRELEKKIRRELEDKIRRELEDKIRRELEDKIRRELETNVAPVRKVFVNVRRPCLAAPLPVPQS